MSLLPPSSSSASPRDSLARDGLALVLTFGLGACGGTAFFWLGLPLPWMLGSMALVFAWAASGRLCWHRQPFIPKGLQQTTFIVLGIMLGSYFTVGMGAQLWLWLPTLTAVLALTILIPLLTSRLFQKRGYDRVTSFFASSPGGLSEMVLLGSAQGGCERTIALVHALRVFIVVFILPLWFRLSGVIPYGNKVTGTRLLEALQQPEQLALLATASLGFWLARLLRFPAGALTGPLLFSAGLHLSGLSTLKPPYELVAVSQVVLGSYLGARFVGIRWGDVAYTCQTAFMSSAVMLFLTALVALAVTQTTNKSFFLLLLAFAPGGVAEMSLISLALGMDTAFVAAHHLVRIALVIAIAPAVFRWQSRGQDRD